MKMPDKPKLNQGNGDNQNNRQPLNLKEDLKQRLLDHHDLQEIFGVKRTTIYNWCRKGILQYMQVGGKRFFDANVIVTWLKEYKQLRVPGTNKKK